MTIGAYLGVAGLGDVGYRFYTATETAVAARVTAGITDAGDGWYSASVTLPATSASVRWDSTGTAEAKAREYWSDPWGNPVPNGYPSGTAGYVLGTNLDATISSRATPAQVQTELSTYGALKPTVAARTLDVTATGEAGVDFDNTVGTLAKGTDITGFNDISTANVQTELTTYGALKPTTATRTLDVSATGEAGIDWANIGAPTTTVALTGTTVGTTTNLTNDPTGVTTLLTRIPAALFTGITSLAQWLGMIAGKQVGNTTARTEMRATGAGSGTYDETTDSQEAIRDRGDTSWITGAGGDPWATALPGAYGAGTAGNIVGNNLNATVSSRATPAQVQTELGTYGALKPTVAARTLDVSTTGEAGLDWANVGGQGTTVGLTATTIATVTNATNVTNPVALTAAYDAAKTAATQTSVDTIDDFLDTEVAAIKAVTDKLNTALEVDGGVYRYTTNALEQAPTGGGASAAVIADAVWDEAISGHLTAGSTGNALNAAGAAGDPWTTILPGVYGAGTAGQIIGDRLDVRVSTRSAGGADSPGVIAVQAVTDKLNTMVEVDGAVYRYTTNALEQAPTGGGDPWATVLPGAYGAGTAGNILGSNLNATVSSRATPAQVQTELTTYGALKPTTAGRTLDVSTGGEAGVDWANVGTPASTNNLSNTTIATVGTLTNAPPDSTGITTLLTRIPAALFAGITSLAQWLGMIAGKQTGNATARTELRATGAGSGTYDETTDSQEATRDRGDAAWVGGAGSDPWATPLPGAYAAGTAGKILGTNLDATVSSRLPTSSYVAPDNASITAIKAKTDTIPVNPASVGDIPTAIQNADALLKRDMSVVTGEASRSPLNAFRLLRNKWSAVETPNTLVVKKEDDVTTAWQAPLTTDSNAAPITSMDPTG